MGIYNADIVLKRAGISSPWNAEDIKEAVDYLKSAESFIPICIENGGETFAGLADEAAVKGKILGMLPEDEKEWTADGAAAEDVEKSGWSAVFEREWKKIVDELRGRIPTLEKTIAFFDIHDNIGDIEITWTYGWTK